MERQIRWNVESESTPEMHTYNLLIINQRIQADRIQQKICEEFNPIIDFVVLKEARVPGTELRYRLITFQTPRKSPTEINWNLIYNGMVRRDRELYTRSSSGGLIDYVDKMIEQNGFRLC